MRSKPTIIFLGPLPPPVHGVSVVNERVVYSNKINEEFSFYALPFSFSKSINEIGFFSIGKLVGYLKIIIKLIWVLLRKRIPNAYFSLSPFGFAFLRDSILVLFLRMFGVKYILHMHGLGVRSSFERSNFVIRILYRVVFSGGHVIILSPKFKSEVDFLRPKSISVVPNGIPAVQYKKRETDTQPFRILFLSNLVKSKGLLTLLDAFEILLQKHKIEAELIFAGADGDMTRQEVLELVKIKKIPNVKLVGQVLANDKKWLFEQATLFVYPTTIDYFPLVVLEAMQAGLPIISTEIGAIREMVDGLRSAGRILNQPTSEILADNIWQIYANSELRSQYSNNAKWRTEEFYTQEIFEKNLMKVFKQIL